MKNLAARRDYRKPILFLFLLSPAVGELLSGASPPLAFFNPVGLVFLSSLYGSGALLVRDYARRWGKSWRSILLLGAAYGIIEEGILVRSFFNPAWKDLGVLGTYGRWLGVNWVWAEWLTIYHAIFSITIPILIVELYYPEARAKLWLSKNQRRLFQSLLLASIVAGFVGFPYFAPELLLWLPACVAAVVFLGWFAKRVPNNPLSQSTLKVAEWKLALLGTSAPLGFLVFFYSTIIPVAAITMAVGFLVALAYQNLLCRWSLRGFSDLQRLSIIAGALGFFMFFDFVLELNGVLGMSGVGVGFLVLVIMLRRRIVTAVRLDFHSVVPSFPTLQPTETTA